MIRGVVFDLDGVLIESEQLWDEVRRSVVVRHNGTWLPEATADMQGMSSPEWSAYMHDRLGLAAMSQDQIANLVVNDLLKKYRSHLPLLPGAAEAVRRLGETWPVALASSANRPIIDEVLAVAGLQQAFAATVSSEEVARGKPSPDVYMEAARRLGLAPRRCLAVEDATNGILSALAAGMAVVAVPNRTYPPPEDVLRRASLVVTSLDELTTAAVAQLGPDSAAEERRLDEQEMESFPASDPHSDWAGPDR